MMFIKYIGKYVEFNIINFLSIQDIFNYMLLNKRTYKLLNNPYNNKLIKFDEKDFVKHIIYYLKYNKIDRIVWCIEKNKDILSKNPFLNGLLIEIFLKKEYNFPILNRMFSNRITKKLFLERVNKRKKYLGNFTF